MKLSIIYAAALLLIFTSFVFAEGSLKDKDQEDSLLTFLEGTYEVVGKYPEGKGTYSGTMTLTRKGNELQITRNIKGTKSTGSAKIITATADNIPVLQVQFSQGKDKLQATYIISTDLDNYARLTGKVYFTGRETKSPGLEALFIHQVTNTNK
jgi:exonuclease III